MEIANIIFKFNWIENTFPIHNFELNSIHDAHIKYYNIIFKLKSIEIYSMPFL